MRRTLRTVAQEREIAEVAEKIFVAQMSLPRPSDFYMRGLELANRDGFVWEAAELFVDVRRERMRNAEEYSKKRSAQARARRTR